MEVSIVIPCYQNKSEIAATVSQVENTVSHAGISAELLLVDDGSSDSTWDEITALSRKYKNVCGFKLGTNIGAYNAILAGFERAKGDAILVMAADGDDPPSLIPVLLEKLISVDAVLANRENSDKGVFTTVISRVFHAALSLVGAKNIPSGGSDFLVVRRNVLHRAFKAGFKSGNTLVHLVQFANSKQTVGYTKGKSKPTSWSLSSKLRLMLQTFKQFIPIPFVKSKPTKFNLISEC